jgi:hypothetical protein
MLGQGIFLRGMEKPRQLFGEATYISINITRLLIFPSTGISTPRPGYKLKPGVFFVC